MARGDLLINLVKASVAGDKGAVRSAVETIIAVVKSKQHTVLADRLARAVQANGRGLNKGPSVSGSVRKRSERIAEIMPRRELGDMILTESCRTAVAQLIEEQQRASLLRAHGLDPRHRLLLVGPPGNGKTSLAEAIAESLAVPLFVARCGSMIGSYLGETAGRLKRVFDYARTTPCVLFFDEFDAVGKERGDRRETGEIKRVVTSLLMQINDLPSYTVITAATNHSELLDRAVWRRFQLRLELPAPGKKELAEYFDRLLSSLDRRPGVAASFIVKCLGVISYAEAEEFTLDVRRRDVMAMKQRPLKTTIEEQLNLWQSRVQPIRSSETEQEVPDG